MTRFSKFSTFEYNSQQMNIVSPYRVLPILFALAIGIFLTLGANAQNDPVKVPAEVKPFVTKGMVPIALETADLNGDGMKDFILVLDKRYDEKAQVDEAGESNRPTLILVRDASGKLTVAAENDVVVYCRMCGGVFGDPFAGIRIKGTSFTIDNYGGSADRWSYSYTFGYSRRDKTWQLTHVEETTFNSLDPNHTTRTRNYAPPKDFGLINFSDFDPGKYRRQGKN